MARFLLLLAFFAARGAFAGVLQVDVLEVGQGDSILVRSPAGKAVLIDAGPGRADIPALLADLGVTSLDLVIATHSHLDHIGGMDAVLENVPVRLYVDSGLPHTTDIYQRVMTLVEEKNIGYRTGRPGQVFKLDDGVKVEVLHPQESPLRDTRSDLNSNSVVTRVTHGDNCFLFTGDSEDPTERLLLQKGLGQCDVLKVAHHGSEHSTSDSWLRTVKPRIAIISVGPDNRYQHPRQEALDRLERVDAEIYRTDVHGTVHLESDGRDITVTTVADLPAGATGPLRDKYGAAPGQVFAMGPLMGGGKVSKADGGAKATVQARKRAAAEERLKMGDQWPLDASAETVEDSAATLAVPQGDTGQDRVRDEPAHNPLVESRAKARAGTRRELANSTAQGDVPSPADGPPNQGLPARPALEGMPAAATRPAPAGDDGACIDLNEASIEELDTLPGIGLARASAIVHYRDTHGPFARLEDLDAVPGIGPATIESVRTPLTCSP